MPRQKLTQRSDGRYKCKFQGKQFYGATQKEAYAKRDEYRRMVEDGMRASSAGKTVSSYAAEWLRTHKASVSDKCYNDYAKQMNVLVAEIGHLRLMDVAPDDMKRVYNHYLDYSASTIKRAKMLFIAMFDAAVENGFARSNPCRSRHAQPHKGTAGSHRAITDEERALIVSTEHRFRVGALLMLYAGLRRGEAMAINIDDDIDLDKGIIHVKKAVRFDSNQPIIAPPKTEHSIREIPLLSVLSFALEGKHGIAMPTAKGAVCSDTAFRRGWDSYLSALSKAAGHKVSIRPHDLRHSYCTMLRDSGVDMKLAMLWMGHADEKMILKIYDHVTTKRMEKAIENVEKSALRVQNGVQFRE